MAFIEEELTNNSKRSYLLDQKKNKIAVVVIVVVLGLIAALTYVLWPRHKYKGVLDDTYKLFDDPLNDGVYNIYIG